jgi:hypothetical protein
MTRKNDGITVSGSIQKDPFSMEEHIRYGKDLKLIRADLENISTGIQLSYDGSGKIVKDIEAARQLIERIQTAMHYRLLNEQRSLPDSELLPIYLGRLNQPGDDSDVG